MGAVLRVSHAPVADLQHVGVVPVARAGSGIERFVLIYDVQHAVRTATPTRPLVMTGPVVLDIASGAPQVAADFLAPQPRLPAAPLADAQHNRSPASIQGLPDITV